MRNSPPTAAGRIFTLFSIVFLVALSFTVVFFQSKHTPTPFLYKRDSSATTATIVTTTQDLPAPSPSQVSTSSASTQSPTPSSKPSPTSASTSVPDNPTSTPHTSTLTSSDVPSSTSTSAVETTTSSQVSSDSATISSSAVASTSSPVQGSDTPSVTYGTSQPLATTSPKVTNQATVMRTGTVSSLPTTTISASAAPVHAASSGFWANKGAVAGTFTVVSLIGIVLLFMGRHCIARKRRHARYRREDEEAYLEKSVQQHSGPGDSGLDEAEASMTNIMTPASADAYPDRQIHFGATPSQVPEVTYAPQDYGIDYPPGTNYHQAEFQYGSNTENAIQGVHRPSPLSQMTPGHPISDPHNGSLDPITADQDAFYNHAGSSHAV